MNQRVMLRNLRHGRTPIDKELLPCLVHLRIRLKTGEINASLTPQKIQNAPTYTVHGIKAECCAARGIVVLHCLDQTDGPLLHRIHHGRQRPIRHHLTEDERLIPLDDLLSRSLIAVLLVGTPEFPLLCGRELLHGREFFYIVREHGHTSFRT